MAESFEVLLVEDNPADADLILEEFEDAKILCNVTIVVNGIEAMDYLNNVGDYADAPRPDLILLDLNLPKKDGRSVLKEIKENDDLKQIPVVILTSSQAESDIIKTYELHANAFVSKPVNLAEFGKIVRAIDDFWINLVKVPPKT